MGNTDIFANGQIMVSVLPMVPQDLMCGFERAIFLRP
jgi:hypothetical protein